MTLIKIHLYIRMVLCLLLIVSQADPVLVSASLGVSPDTGLIGWGACGDTYFIPHYNISHFYKCLSFLYGVAIR